MKLDFIKGSSSLLFIISTIKCFYSSTLLTVKLSNIFLVIASFIYNASSMSQCYLFYDYLGIFLVSSSYINNIIINILLLLSLIYEYKCIKSIEYTKNIAFLLAVSKSLVYTYLYVDKLHFNILLQSVVYGIFIYKIRNYFYVNKNNKKYNLFLTYLFHICIMNIIYISSITAN